MYASRPATIGQFGSMRHNKQQAVHTVSYREEGCSADPRSATGRTGLRFGGDGHGGSQAKERPGSPAPRVVWVYGPLFVTVCESVR